MIDQEEEDLWRAPQELFWDKETRQTLVLGRCLSYGIQEEVQHLLRKNYFFISPGNFSGAERDKGEEEVFEEVYEEEVYEEEGYEEEVYEEDVYEGYDKYEVYEEDVYEEVYAEEVYETLEHSKVYNNNKAQDSNRHVVKEKEWKNCEMQKMKNIVDMVGVEKMLTEFSDTMLSIKKDMLTIKTDMEVMKNDVEHFKEEIKGEIKAIKEEVLNLKQESNEGKQKELFKKDISKLKEDMEDMKEVAETSMLIGNEVIKIKQMLQDLSLP